jgi:hypothetical protein
MNVFIRSTGYVLCIRDTACEMVLGLRTGVALLAAALCWKRQTLLLMRKATKSCPPFSAQLAVTQCTFNQSQCRSGRIGNSKGQPLTTTR